MANTAAILKAHFGTDDPAQCAAMYKAACALADRYRKERDGARSATESLKSKTADAALFETDVQSAIAKALTGTGATVGAIDRDSPEAAQRLAKTVPLLFQRTESMQKARKVNADGTAV